MGAPVADLEALFATTETPRRREDRFAGWREEIKGYTAELKNIRHQPHDEAMGWLSSVSARALEMQIWTLDHDERSATKFRIDVVLPFKQEIRDQFSMVSRRQAVAEMDFKLSGGQIS